MVALVNRYVRAALAGSVLTLVVAVPGVQANLHEPNCNGDGGYAWQSDDVFRQTLFQIGGTYAGVYVTERETWDYSGDSDESCPDDWSDQSYGQACTRSEQIAGPISSPAIDLPYVEVLGVVIVPEGTGIDPVPVTDEPIGFSHDLIYPDGSYASCFGRYDAGVYTSSGTIGTDTHCEEVYRPGCPIGVDEPAPFPWG